MLGKLQRWRALNWGERGQLLLAAAALPCIDLLLRCFGYRRLLAGIERITPQADSRQTGQADLHSGEQWARQAAMAGAHLPLFNVSCLRQALLVHWQLRLRGVSPQLKIGLRPQSGQRPDAHAWVELDGVALGQDQLSHHAFMPSPSEVHERPQ